MKKSIKLLTATTAAVIAIGCATGATIAVNAVSDSARLDSTAGVSTVGAPELTVVADGLRAYSAVVAQDTDTDTFEDESGNLYKYEAVSGDDTSFTFSQGGKVVLDGKNVVAADMVAGDKFEFDIEVTSSSKIAFDYRAELYVDASDGENLIDELVFSANGLSLYRNDNIEGDGAIEDMSAFLTDYTEWKVVGIGEQTVVERVRISVALPMTAKAGGERVKIKYTASAVQNAELLPDIAQIKIGDGVEKFKTFADAIKFAENNAISDIDIIGNTVLEEGTIAISRPLRFKGVVSENEENPVIKGARIAIKQSASATFDGVTFSGSSYIDVTEGGALTLRNCTSTVNALRYYDSTARGYLSDSAFIVSGSAHADTLVTISNCTLAPENGAAICMRNGLSDGSSITDSTLGMTEWDSEHINASVVPYDGTAVVILEGAAANAAVEFTDNNVYGATAVSLGSNENTIGGRFMFCSRNNKVYGCTGLFAAGTSNGAVADVGTKLIDIDDDTAQAITVANFGKGLLFCGVDVDTDGRQRFSKGNFELFGIKAAEFFDKYVSVVTLENNVVALFKDGEPYAYINSADNDSGYVIDLIAEL